MDIKSNRIKSKGMSVHGDDSHPMGQSRGWPQDPEHEGLRSPSDEP